MFVNLWALEFSGVLWISYMLVKKEKQVSLGLYIARGKKEITPAQELWEECQSLDLRLAVR